MGTGFRTIDGCRIWVEDTGGDGPIVAMSHGLLWSAEMYRPQIDALAGQYRVIAWDHRGQGRSDVPEGRSVSIEQVTSDAIAILEPLGQPVHFVGLSMGGFVGMRVAARRPELVRSLVILESAADPEPTAHLPKYGRLMWAARLLGVRRWLARQVLGIMCAEAFVSDPARADDVERLTLALMDNRRSIYKAVRGVLEREACEEELAHIRCPTAVMHGTGDRAIARERARAMFERIEGAVWVDIQDAGHTSTLEQPEAVTAALIAFLDGVATA
ncbi:MAG: alpha/beta fold hydrolase [Myxococcota bacterium]